MATQYRCIFRNALGTGVDVIQTSEPLVGNQATELRTNTYGGPPAILLLNRLRTGYTQILVGTDYFDSVSAAFESENAHLENLDTFVLFPVYSIETSGHIIVEDDEGMLYSNDVLYAQTGSRPIVDCYFVHPLSITPKEIRDDGLEYYRADFTFRYSYGPEADPEFGDTSIRDEFIHSVYIPVSAVQDDSGNLHKLRTVHELAEIYKLLQFSNVEVTGAFVNDSAPSIECIEIPVSDDSLEYNSELILEGGPEYVGTQITSITHDNREPLPIFNITINAGEGSLAPFNDLAPFYQERVRSSVEQVLMETDGVSIRQWALESDFFHTSLETMDLNELVELLTHVAVVGRD